jgi:diguanylate cyclase (GGDEF)-like protein
MNPVPHRRRSSEATQLRAPGELDILDMPPDERFERLARLARHLFDVPTALVHLEVSDRLWSRNRDGSDTPRDPRTLSLCQALRGDDRLLVVRDTREDPRTRDEPLVLTGDDPVRFVAGVRVRSPDGTRLGTLYVMDREPRALDDSERGLLRDLGALMERELATLEMATTDELTGLTNRRGFHATAAHSLALCRRLDRPATLVLFDLNDFKRVNDVLGHAAGDAVLAAFAEDLLATFRDSDVVCRLGGDEFAVLLSGATPEELLRPLTLMAVRVNARNEHSRPGAQVAYSHGVAGYDPEVHRDVGDLLAEADRAMYARKRVEQRQA